MRNLKQQYGPWALITGASSGIGREYARKLASAGLSVVLVARNSKKLETLAYEIKSEYSVGTKVLLADLTTNKGIQIVKEQTEKLEIGLLVNNAGKEDSDHFLNIPVENHISAIDLNIKAPLALTHHFGEKMVQRQKGGIIAMSSIVAFQGVPYIANYAGTKAYDLIFFEGIAAEFKKQNVDVLVVAPGFTDTNLASAYDFSGTPMKPLSPAYVAHNALNRLGKGRLSVPGPVNKFLFLGGKHFFSRSLNTLSFGKVFGQVLRHRLKKHPIPIVDGSLNT
ncbi:MAG: SDR family NAD(P)-dependent oxidoreductase [Flavobacteriaceae bacterium]